MLEAEWIQAMQKKTSQVLDDLCPIEAWLIVKEVYPHSQSVFYLQEEEERILVKSVDWKIEQDYRKYFGPGHAARLLISSFIPSLLIKEKYLSEEEIVLYTKKRQQLSLDLSPIKGIVLAHKGTTVTLNTSAYWLQINSYSLRGWPNLCTFIEWLDSCLDQ